MGMGQNWILQKIVYGWKWTILEAPRVSVLIPSHWSCAKVAPCGFKLCDLVVSMASHLAQTFNGAILPANTGIQKKKLQTRQCNSPLLGFDSEMRRSGRIFCFTFFLGCISRMCNSESFPRNSIPNANLIEIAGTRGRRWIHDKFVISNPHPKSLCPIANKKYSLRLK